MTQKHVISFQMNYLRLYQARADSLEGAIKQYNYLVDELIFNKQRISQIKEDAGDDGLSKEDRMDIRDFRNTMDVTLDIIDDMPDLALMQERLDRLNHKIDYRADLWGIDSW